MIERDYVKELQKNNAIAFVPGGNSMWPFLKHKNQSVVVEKKTERLKLYDVALYCRSDGKNVLHRIVKVNEDGYIIQGDSQFYIEEIKEENVVGKMTGFYKGKKYVSVDNKHYVRKTTKWVNSKFKKKIYCKIFFSYLSFKHKVKVLIKKICRIK